MTTSPFLRLVPLLSTFVFFTICPSLVAQQTQYDRGTPPQHAAGVSSLGSYSSADIGTVNLSNGALNLKVPLGSVGGRGFSLPLTLNWSSKLWSASTDTDRDRDGSQKTVAYADFARGDDEMGGFMLLGPGWTIGAAPTITSQVVSHSVSRYHFSASVETSDTVIHAIFEDCPRAIRRVPSRSSAR